MLASLEGSAGAWVVAGEARRMRSHVSHHLPAACARCGHTCVTCHGGHTCLPGQSSPLVSTQPVTQTQSPLGHLDSVTSPVITCPMSHMCACASPRGTGPWPVQSPAIATAWQQPPQHGRGQPCVAEARSVRRRDYLSCRPAAWMGGRVWHGMRLPLRRLGWIWLGRRLRP
jgi:hypothetical protein